MSVQIPECKSCLCSFPALVCRQTTSLCLSSPSFEALRADPCPVLSTVPSTWERPRAQAGDHPKSWPHKGLCLFVGQTSFQLARVGSPWPGRQGLRLGTWLGPPEVLGRSRLERVLVLSALMKALEDFGPRCQAAAAWRARATGFGRSLSSPAGKPPSSQLMQHEHRPSLSLLSPVRLQPRWDPASVFSPTGAVFIFLGASCDTGELRACKSGQEAWKPRQAGGSSLVSRSLPRSLFEC